MSQSLACSTGPVAPLPNVAFGVQTVKVIQATIHETDPPDVYDQVLERIVWLLCLVMVDGTCVFYNSNGPVNIDFDQEPNIVRVSKVTIGTMPGRDWVRQIDAITNTTSPSSDTNGVNISFGRQRVVDPELEWIAEVIANLFRERHFDEYIKQCDEQVLKVTANDIDRDYTPIEHVFVDADRWQLQFRYIEGWIHTDRRGVTTTGRDRLDKYEMMRKMRDMVEGVNQGPITLKEWKRIQKLGPGEAVDLF